MEVIQLNYKKGVNWSYLIIGILFIVTALISFSNPRGNLVAIVALFSIAAILKGIFELFVRSRIDEYSGKSSTSLIILGILDIIIGIFFLFNMNLGIIALSYIFAFWFLIDSVVELFTAKAWKLVSNAIYWLIVVISIIGIIVGLMLLFNPLGSALTLSFMVGFYFMWFGIEYLISAF